jgi:hypothetical protein
MRKRKYTAVFILAEITGLSGDRQKLTARVTSQGEHHHKVVVLDLDQKFRTDKYIMEVIYEEKKIYCCFHSC